MLFDSWGGVLADGLFQQFSLAYTRQVVSGLIREHEGRQVPVIVFTKGGGLWLEEIATCGCDAIGLDWTVNLRQARRRVGNARSEERRGGKGCVRMCRSRWWRIH